MTKNDKLYKYLSHRKYIFRYIKDLSTLSDYAILESVIKYWEREDIKYLKNYLWKQKFIETYQLLKSKKISNIDHKDINFIDNYIKYAK